MSQKPPKTKNVPSSTTHRFHETHGNDIMMYHWWTSARRTETKDNGLVFIAKPIKPNEKITIKLVEVSDKLPGIISIGFTTHDPSSLRYDLPKSTRSELKRKSGFWICSLSKYLCVKGRILFFYVTASGSIHYGIDYEEKGHFEKGVDTRGQIWALIDVWSPPTTIQLVNFDPSTQPVVLHHVSSRNVHIKENNAQKRYKKHHTSYTFTSQPLDLDKYIIIKILDEGSLSLGVTSCDPAFLRHRHLPDNPNSLLDRPEYWVVINDPTWNFKKDEQLSYLISRKGEMKIWKNSSLLLKIVHVDHTLQLWGFFVLGTTKKIEVTSSSGNVETFEKAVAVPSPSAPKLVEYEPPMTLSVENTTTESRDDSICVVCCEKVTEAVLYPCGHMCMCFDCAKRQWRAGGDGLCPMCRATIQDVLKVFKS